MPLRLKLSRSALILCSLTCVAASTPTVASAQEAMPAPAHMTAIDGAVTIDRDGAPDAALVNMPIVPGDHLRTTTGRTEILFPDGTALDIDQFSELTFEAENGIHLAEGRALLRVPRGGITAAQYELTTPASAVTASSPGEYRLAYPDAFESTRVEDFERWLDNRRAWTASADTPEYLPADLQMYSPMFDQYGSWSYTAPYGYVWYPAVGGTWRPYYNGSWTVVPGYGWTWIGADLWAWPTHHYGRWGFVDGRWFWIPARSWAPAWVAWGAADGLVSWCPLGWDSRPVFTLSFRGGDPWRGWIVMPRGSFGYSRVAVRGHVLAPGRLLPSAFIVQRQAPIAVPRADRAASRNGSPQPLATAVPRSVAAPSAAVRAPVQGSTAVPRSTAPGAAIAVPRPASPPAYRGPSANTRPGVATPRSPTSAGSRGLPSAGSPHVLSRDPSAPSAVAPAAPTGRIPRVPQAQRGPAAPASPPRGATPPVYVVPRAAQPQPVPMPPAAIARPTPPASVVPRAPEGQAPAPPAPASAGTAGPRAAAPPSQHPAPQHQPPPARQAPARSGGERRPG